RAAVTRYRVLERFARPAPLTVLAVQLGTGRTHQIRVHLAHLGFPVAGDRTYLGRGGRRGRRRGPEPALPELQSRLAALGGHALHAGLLGFRHPATGEALRFEAPPPPAFA